FNLFRSSATPKSGSNTSRRPKAPRLRLELLEDRSVPAVLTVNTTLDGIDHSDNRLTLREALAAANRNSTAGFSARELALVSGALGDDTIQFGLGGNTSTGRAIRLDGGPLKISDTTWSTTIIGPSDYRLTINGAGRSRVWTIESGRVASLSNLTIVGGDAGDANGGGILNKGT